MSQPEGAEERIREGDGVFIRPFGHPVTTNEIHAALLGLGSAVVIVLAWGAGLQEVAAMATLALLGYAILGRPLGRSMPEDSPGYCDGKPVGRKTIRHEPWWFLIPYAGVFALAHLTGVIAI